MFTLKGKAVLLENLKDNFTGNKTDPIKYMAVGMGRIPPSELDTKLVNEKSRSDADIEVDLPNSCIIAKSKFDARTVKGSISEVGLFTEKGVLVSRDIVKDRFVISDGVMEVTYKLIVAHDYCVTDWEIADNGLFVTHMTVPIRGIYEDNGNGYEKLNDLKSVIARTSSYYHDLIEGKLYINRSKNYIEGDDIYVSFDQAVRKIDSKASAEDINVPLAIPTIPEEKSTTTYDKNHTLKGWIDNCKTGDVLLFKEDNVDEDTLITIRNSCSLQGKTPSGTILNIQGIVIPPSKNKISLRLKSIKIGEEYFEDTIFFNNSNHSIIIGTKNFESIETKPLGNYGIRIDGSHDVHQDETAIFTVTDIGEIDIPEGTQVSFEIGGKEVGISKFNNDGEAPFSYISDQLGKRTVTAKVVIDDIVLKEKLEFEVIPNEYTIIIPQEFEDNIELVNAIHKLNKLTGLVEVKKHITKMMMTLIMNKIRTEKGKKPVRISKNLVFTGNPGTGKTTVAKLYGEIFYHLKLLTVGKFYPFTRADLIGIFQGNTAVQTQKAFNDSKGSILFIDEAYTLCNGRHDTYGQECLATIVGNMGDDGIDDRVVIMVGYDKEIREMMKYNPGLISRFNTYINFKDYNSRELLSIFKQRMKDEEALYDNEVEGIVLSHFEEKIKNLYKGFGNARYVNQLCTILTEITAERTLRERKDTSMLQITVNDIKETLRLLKQHEGE